MKILKIIVALLFGISISLFDQIVVLSQTNDGNMQKYIERL